MSDRPFRVLGLNFAYTTVGPVTRLLTETLEACRIVAMDHGIDPLVERVDLIKVLQGFTVPVQGVIPAYLKQTAEKHLLADVVIFASPVIWSLPSALFCQYMADITPFESDGGFPLRGKASGVIAHCRESGGEKVVSDVMTPFRHFGSVFPPHAGFWQSETGALRSENKWQLHDHMNVLAVNLVEQAIANMGSKPEFRS